MRCCLRLGQRTGGRVGGGAGVVGMMDLQRVTHLQGSLLKPNPLHEKPALNDFYVLNILWREKMRKLVF